MYASILASAAFAASAVAAPMTARSDVPEFFALNTVLPTNDTFTTFSGINAADGALWVNKPTNQYCPTGKNITCPTGTGILTSMYLGVGGTVFFNENSPAVQQLYIAADGLMSFTSYKGSLPPKTATQGPFNYEPQDDKVGTFTGPGCFKACPDKQETGASPERPWYRVYNEIPDISVPLSEDCFEIFLTGAAKNKSSTFFGAYAFQ